MRKALRGMAVLVCAGLLAGASACGAPHLRLSRSPYTYNTAIVVGTPAVSNIDPVTARTVGDRLFEEVVYGTLVSLTPAGAPTAQLAKTWHSQNGGRLWTITLNPFAKWWSGRPVTATDVAWSLTFYKNPRSHFPRRRELGDLLWVKVESPTRLKIALRRADPDFVANVLSTRGGLWILPSFLLKHLPPDRVSGSDYLTQIKDVMGSGPFRPIHTTAGKSMTWTAYPHYYGGAPKTKYLKWRWKPRVEISLKEKTLDLGVTPLPAIAPGYRRERAVSTSEWVATIDTRVAGLAPHTAAALLSLGINRQALSGVPAWSSVWPGDSAAVSPQGNLSRSLARFGFRLKHQLWIRSNESPLTITLEEPRQRSGQLLARRLANQWQADHIPVRLVPFTFQGPVDVRLLLVPAFPKAERLSRNQFPVVWPTEYWYHSPLLVHWTVNVWQPFYEVAGWRVLYRTSKTR